jgi:hypothetical protein
VCRSITVSTSNGNSLGGGRDVWVSSAQAGEKRGLGELVGADGMEMEIARW